jgi:peptidyl-tRNA hydrolase, PTH1 family
MKFLIAGLGNIGAEYELTRHNVGFLALDHVADQQKVTFNIDRLAYKSEFKFKGRTFHLIKPTTYMNLSGKAINYWMKHLDIAIENTLIIVDDIALPFGKLRMRIKGSSAGHNGLSHIELTLGSNVYPRIRFGIGDNFPKGGQVDYVLNRFTKEEFDKLPEHFNVVSEMIHSFGMVGIEKTMTLFNKRS